MYHKKIVLFFIILFTFIGVKAQTPVVISQPYIFKKYVSVNDSLILLHLINNPGIGHLSVNAHGKVFLDTSTNGGKIYFNIKDFTYQDTTVSLANDTIGTGNFFVFDATTGFGRIDTNHFTKLIVPNPTHGTDALNLNYFNSHASPPNSPDLIIAGLSTNQPTDTTIMVAPGIWRINNIIYNIGTNTNFILQHPDSVKSRYEVVYATKADTLGIAIGVLNINPIPPNIPDSTVFVSSVLITTHGATVIYPNGKTIYVADSFLTNDRILTGAGHSLTETFPNGTNGTGMRLDSTSISLGVSGLQKPFAGHASFIADTTQMNFQYITNTNNFYGVIASQPGLMFIGRIDSVGQYSTFNYGTLTPYNGISVQLDDPASIFGYQTSGNETAIRANPLGIPDMNILRAVADSAASSGASNGINGLNGTGSIGLGGSLTTGTTIDAGTFSYLMTTEDGSGNNANFEANNAQIFLHGANASFTKVCVVQVVGTGVVIEGGNSNGTKGISIDNNGFIPGVLITDQQEHVGLHADSLSIYPLKVANSKWNYLTKGVADSLYTHTGSLGTVTSVTSANANATVANTTTTPVITIVAAPNWTTARNLAGNSVDGSANVAFANKFIVQGTADAGLSGAQFLGALTTGIIKNTTTTGVVSIAAAGTDYQAPISLTTTGTGASTFISNVLNIPTPSLASGANPTATLGLSAVNGSAGTFMRSDAAPALSQSIVPTWTGYHTFAGKLISSLNATTVTPIFPTQAQVTFAGADANSAVLQGQAFGGHVVFEAIRTDGTNASPTAVVNNDELGTYAYNGYDGTSIANEATASVQASATENWSATAHGTQLIFNTTPNTTTALTAGAVLDGNGNFGVVGNESVGSSTGANVLSYSSGSTALTVLGANNASARRVLELVGPALNTANVVGEIDFDALSNTLQSNYRVVQMFAVPSGSTSGNRGGAFTLATKVDGGSLTNAFLISNAQVITIPHYTTNNGLLFTNGSGVISQSTALPSGTTATTQSSGDNSTNVATTAYVTSATGVTFRGIGQATLVSGTKAISITGVTTSSRAFVQAVSQGGTVSTTFEYSAVCTSGTLTITAITTGNVTNALDTSTLNYYVLN